MKNSIAVLNPVVPFEEYSWVLNSTHFGMFILSFANMFATLQFQCTFMLFWLSTLGILFVFLGILHRCRKNKRAIAVDSGTAWVSSVSGPWNLPIWYRV